MEGRMEGGFGGQRRERGRERVGAWERGIVVFVVMIKSNRFLSSLLRICGSVLKSTAVFSRKNCITYSTALCL